MVATVLVRPGGSLHFLFERRLGFRPARRVREMCSFLRGFPRVRHRCPGRAPQSGQIKARAARTQWGSTARPFQRQPFPGFASQTGQRTRSGPLELEVDGDIVLRAYLGHLDHLDLEPNRPFRKGFLDLRLGPGVEAKRIVKRLDADGVRAPSPREAALVEGPPGGGKVLGELSYPFSS